MRFNEYIKMLYEMCSFFIKLHHISYEATSLFLSQIPYILRTRPADKLRFFDYLTFPFSNKIAIMERIRSHWVYFFNINNQTNHERA
jgi:hypothetical protein